MTMPPRRFDPPAEKHVPGFDRLQKAFYLSRAVEYDELKALAHVRQMLLSALAQNSIRTKKLDPTSWPFIQAASYPLGVMYSRERYLI